MYSKNSRWILFLCVFLVVVHAAQAQFDYSTNGDTITLTNYDGPGGAVTISNFVTSIGEAAFEGTSLTSVILPNSVTNIGVEAFWGCFSLASVALPNSITSIGEAAFDDCTSLTSVTLPNSVTSIGENAFWNCTRLASVAFPNSLTNIGETAFEYCYFLTNLTIPNSVTSIGAGAFTDCTRLTSVTIGSSVGIIEGGVFWGCTSLTGVYFLGDVPATNYSGPSDYDSIFEYDSDATAYYLPGTTGWSTNYDGIPTAPWMLPYPVILSNSRNFGIRPSGFSFTVSWATNATVIVEASTNLAASDWQPLQTNSIAGTNGAFNFSDLEWTNYSARFYRVVAQ
jgi:hypothetical protein